MLKNNVSFQFKNIVNSVAEVGGLTLRWYEINLRETDVLPTTAVKRMEKSNGYTYQFERIREQSKQAASLSNLNPTQA